MKNQLLLAFIAIYCSAICSAAGKPAASAIEVRVTGSNSIVLRVNAPSSLMDVLGALCDATHASCDGLVNARGVTVAPLEINDGWNETLSKLLGGTQLNYVASPASSEQQRGALVLQAASSAPQSSPAAANEAQTAATETSSYSAPATTYESAADADESSQPSEESQSAKALNAQPAVMNSSVQSTTGISGSPLTSVMPEPSSSEKAAIGFPFPDSHGNIIPANNEPMQYLPFPDSHGNPIPADPNAPVTSPFPTEAIRDANKNPH